MHIKILLSMISFFMAPNLLFGAVVITFSEQGNDVIATVSGSFSNITGLSSPSNNFFAGNSFLIPSINRIALSGGQSSNTSYSGASFSGDDIINEAAGNSFANSSSLNNGYIGIDGTSILLPQSATSGTLSGTVTWQNTDLTTMGLNVGTRVASWDSGNESITVTVVPEPAHVATAFSAIVFLSVFLRGIRRAKYA